MGKQAEFPTFEEYWGPSENSSPDSDMIWKQASNDSLTNLLWRGKDEILPGFLAKPENTQVNLGKAGQIKRVKLSGYIEAQQEQFRTSITISAPSLVTSFFRKLRGSDNTYRVMVERSLNPQSVPKRAVE